jgi:hypothetical protein
VISFQRTAAPAHSTDTTNSIVPNGGAMSNGEKQLTNREENRLFEHSPIAMRRTHVALDKKYKP